MDTIARWLRQIVSHAPAILVGLAVLAVGSAPLAAVWCAASRLAYVGFVAESLRRRTTERPNTAETGADADWRRFRTRASWLMDNDAVAFGALCLVTRGSLDVPVPAWAMIAAGLALIAIGLGTKVWASASLPDGAYHWRSFFVTEEVVRVSTIGPYRFLSNPMYTVGYAHAYGFALVFGSVWGLVAALCSQSLMLLFAAVVERPHFRDLRERASVQTSAAANASASRTTVSRVR